MKYEYKGIGSNSFSDSLAQVNALGAQGWRVTATYCTVSHNRFVLERVIEEDVTE